MGSQRSRQMGSTQGKRKGIRLEEAGAEEKNPTNEVYGKRISTIGSTEKATGKGARKKGRDQD